MTKGIEVRTNEMEIVEAIKYMYGMDSLKEAEDALAEGEFTREQILKAIAWYIADGLGSFDTKESWVATIGMEYVTTDYQNKF